ncbi:hypothetical protein M404DRAFT_994538 [Pisolithus tinctorius Marx 270]|uniref:Uncharacterized protein n=1 Tax=Pisolithus tinctorius Marx 270 TaxID=870435 RepID=A0A0C3PRZ3_PISTI|nr:hypothetical protein M404DRAFT_994538 [Pisolithus tinctorius Marx 270]
MQCYCININYLCRSLLGRTQTTSTYSQSGSISRVKPLDIPTTCRCRHTHRTAWVIPSNNPHPCCAQGVLEKSGQKRSTKST